MDSTEKRGKREYGSKDSYRDEEVDGEEVLHPRTGDRRFLEATERHRARLKVEAQEEHTNENEGRGKVKFRKDTQMLSHPYAGEQFVGVPTWSRDQEVETMNLPFPSTKEKAEGKSGEESKSSHGGGSK